MDKAGKTESETGKSPSRFTRWMQKHVVNDVPGEIAACEFECSVGECAHERWMNCERRLKRVSEQKRQAS